MSALVATIAYMRLPTAEEYGTFAISAHSASDLGQSSLLSFKYDGSGLFIHAFKFHSLSRPFHSLARLEDAQETKPAVALSDITLTGKRKSNDGSGLQIKRLFMPTAEGSNQNQSFLCEPAWVTIPRSTDSPRDSRNVHSSTSSDVLQNSQSIQQACSSLLSKKRVYVPMSEVSVCRPEISSFIESPNEIIRLREALKTERKALRKLHKELEAEKCASAAAANEAMAMIRRLQGEKSAALVESRHYRLASEERETYNREAITLLKEALLAMENEVHTLQEHVEAYRSMFLKIKSRHGNPLGRSKEDEPLLLLEGNELAPFSSEDINDPLYLSQVGITGVTEDQAFGDRMKWQHQLSEVIPHEGPDFEDTCCEGKNSDLDGDKIFGTQDLDDISMSILDRVARLEERFACLGHNQKFDSVSADQDFHAMTRNLDESVATIILERHLSPPFSRRSGQVREGFATNSLQDLDKLGCLDSERVTMSSEDSEQEHVVSACHKGAGLEAFKMNIRGSSRRLSQELGQESTFIDTRGAEMEAMHDVYDVQCDPNSCGMPPCTESCKGLAGSADIIVNDSLQMSDIKLAEPRSSIALKDTILSNHSEGCNAPADGKWLPEVRPMDEEARKSSTATEDVDNLKLRLQALEGERAFMKVAIDSLRKENMELKLLQDIAQQLRELKGDVLKTGTKSPGRNEQLPFLSFLKGILSFTRTRNSSTTKGTRLFNSPHKEQGLPGLFHLLKYSPKEEGHTRVMRECKIKLSSVGVSS
ncbi:hypothetical protein L7F22_031078 [Adiantum nelumboides]|nr:hypothetical protein [Adiantum nelumboides]